MELSVFAAILNGGKSIEMVVIGSSDRLVNSEEMRVLANSHD